MPTITIEIWIAMAELAYAAKDVRLVVSTQELRDKVNNLFNDQRPGVAIHISQHVVAQKKKNTGYNKCFLSEDGRGTRRLYLPGDAIHESRTHNPQTIPLRNDISVNYRYLLDWYLDSIGNHENVEPTIEIAGNGENVANRINNLIENFQLYLEHFINNIKFSGPSIYFHQKTINEIRATPNYRYLLGNTYFLELIYATLVSWGMHSMGRRGPKMADFEDFQGSIRVAEAHFVELSEYKINEMQVEEIEQKRANLLSVFRMLKTMKGRSFLVGNSKVMHHLLPDLIPPIDRTHTIKFFYGNTNIAGDESTIFFDCLKNFHRIAKAVDWNEYELEGFNTSIPKIIDNAIMGFVMRNHQ